MWMKDLTPTEPELMVVARAVENEDWIVFADVTEELLDLMMEAAAHGDDRVRGWQLLWCFDEEGTRARRCWIRLLAEGGMQLFGQLPDGRIASTQEIPFAAVLSGLSEAQRKQIDCGYLLWTGGGSEVVERSGPFSGMARRPEAQRLLDLIDSRDLR